MSQSLKITLQDEPALLRATPDAPAPSHKVTAFDLVAAQPWAILPNTLETIVAISRRENQAVEAVEAKLGRPLQNTRTVSTRGSVAIVPVVGPIFRYANLFTDISGATSLEVLAQDFTAALENPNIASIVLNIDSPGGQAAGISEFAQMVRSANKPVVAYVDGQAASAAYWIASAADKIITSKTAELGSIGAVVAINQGNDKGVIEIVSSQSPKKRPDVSTDEGRAQIQSRIDSFAQVFIEDVAANRGISVDTVLADFGQGDMRMGAEAVRLGMADKISTLENVLSDLLANPSKKGATMTATSGTPAAEMPVITREYLAEHHADILSAVAGEAAAEAAGAERQRIQDVEAQSLKGHEQLIQTLKFDGHTTGAEAAMQVLAAENGLKASALKTNADEAPAAVTFAAAADPKPEQLAASTQAETQALADSAAKLVVQANSRGEKLSYAAAVKQVMKEQQHG